MTAYEYKYYSASGKWLNTNTNIIRFPKNDRIRIRILFGFPKRPNTNTNIIRLPRNDQIRILFGFPIMTEYKYHLASQKWSNSINKCKFCEVPKRKASKTSSEAHKVMLNLPSPLMTEANYKCKQLPIHVTHPMWLVYDDKLKFWRTD